MPHKYKRAEDVVGNPDKVGREQRDNRPHVEKTRDYANTPRIPDSDGTGRNDYDQKIDDARKDMG